MRKERVMIEINKKFESVEDGIQNLLLAANADYNQMRLDEKMKKEFSESWVLKQGQKYIKIIRRNAVWGFVVNTDNDKKFKKGDILKCAGWSAPTRNKARGNVLEGGYCIQWTGPLYLNSNLNMP